MQTWRLTVGPDGQVRIPDTKPGEIVMVQVSEAEPAPRMPLMEAKTPEERASIVKRRAVLPASCGRNMEIICPRPTRMISTGKTGCPMPVFETITYSTHAEWRMRKRGFSRHDVELVLRIGDGYMQDDGTWVYELGRVRVVIVDRDDAAHVVTVIRLRKST